MLRHRITKLYSEKNVELQKNYQLKQKLQKYCRLFYSQTKLINRLVIKFDQ